MVQDHFAVRHDIGKLSTKRRLKDGHFAASSKEGGPQDCDIQRPLLDVFAINDLANCFHSRIIYNLLIFPMERSRAMATAKEAAREVLERLSDQVTWNDIMYELYVKQKLEAGLADIEAGRTVPHQQLKAEILGNEN